MKGVTIEGVEYLSASSLAKQFRYTTDYIGQLCRAKKVDAKLVGRTWYVNPISLTKHKTARYKKVLPPEKTQEVASEITLSRTKIDPEVFISKHQKTAAISQPNFARRIDWKPLKYEPDEVELLPKVSQNKNQSHEIKLNLAEAKSVTVKNQSTKTKLVAEDLPTVSLKGKLTIESLNESFLADETNNKLVPEILLTEVNNMAKNIDSSSKKAQINSLGKLSISGQGNHKQDYKTQHVSLIPTNLSRAKDRISTVSATQVKPESQKAEILLLGGAVTLTLCLFLLLFGELNLVARPGFYEWEFVFSTQSLPALVSLFSK